MGTLGAGCGAASLLFHSFLAHERPFCKSVCRRLDYSSVSTATTLAVAALRPNMPKAVFAASVVGIPINPLAVGSAQILLLEVSESISAKHFHDYHVIGTSKLPKISHLIVICLVKDCFLVFILL